MTLTTQFYTMLAMVGMGCFFGASLDTYGRFLKRPKRARWLVFINDLLFWIMQGLLIFYALLMVNKGELRFYIFIALICGYAAYQSLLKTMYMNLLEFLIRCVILTYRFLANTVRRLIIRPIQLLIKFLIFLLIGLWGILITLIKILLRISLIGLKILFAPIRWIILLFWRLIPIKYKYKFQRFFQKVAGVFRKLKNIKSIFVNWWNNRRKT